MDKLALNTGYFMYDFIERKKYFLGRNILRVFLILYFSIVAFLFERTRFDLYLRIGSLYLNLKRITKAREYYRHSDGLVKNNDQCVRVLMCLGNLSYTTGSYKEAISYYEKALNISHYKTTILSNLAFAYEAVNENDKALKYAQDSIEISKLESDLGHTILPEDNVDDLIIRLKEKLPRMSR